MGAYLCSHGRHDSEPCPDCEKWARRFVRTTRATPRHHIASRGRLPICSHCGSFRVADFCYKDAMPVCMKCLSESTETECLHHRGHLVEDR